MTAEEITEKFNVTCKKCKTEADVTDEESVSHREESHNYNYVDIRCLKCGEEATAP